MRITKEFLKYGGDVPIIPVYLQDGTSCNAILDSGAEATLVASEFLEKIECFKNVKRDSIANFIGLEGPKKHVFRDVECLIAIEKGNPFFKKITFTEMPMKSINQHLKETYDITAEMIIGSDILSSMHAVLDFNNRTITLDDDLSGK